MAREVRGAVLARWLDGGVVYKYVHHRWSWTETNASSSVCAPHTTSIERRNHMYQGSFLPPRRYLPPVWCGCPANRQMASIFTMPMHCAIAMILLYYTFARHFLVRGNVYIYLSEDDVPQRNCHACKANIAFISAKFLHVAPCVILLFKSALRGRIFPNSYIIMPYFTLQI